MLLESRFGAGQDRPGRGGRKGRQARADQVLVASAALRCAVTAVTVARAGVAEGTLERSGRGCYARVQADDLQAGLVSGAEASGDSRRRACRCVERTLSVGKQGSRRSWARRSGAGGASGYGSRPELSTRTVGKRSSLCLEWTGAVPFGGEQRAECHFSAVAAITAAALQRRARQSRWIKCCLVVAPPRNMPGPVRGSSKLGRRVSPVQQALLRDKAMRP
ncbi:hypothetical protein DE146DRAFT_669393 [Phaeosphaeria sp. MPI-PUGE-AT-0046c]|nr:hypothetical protein DE146DRAFT_669393 [Phaeosphaeria sp. MPI-PUGE-AT-0046c]